MNPWFDYELGYTTIIVRGPDVDGVLASITACIASCGCSVAELHAGYRKVLSQEDDTAVSNIEEGEVLGSNDESSTSSSNSAVESLVHLLNPPPPLVEDIFLIRDRATQQALENDELESIGQQILAAAKDPLNSHSLKGRLEELQFENDALAERVLMLEGMLESRQIKVVRSGQKVDESSKDWWKNGIIGVIAEWLLLPSDKKIVNKLSLFYASTNRNGDSAKAKSLQCSLLAMTLSQERSA
jgi:hypothetical protein